MNKPKQRDPRLTLQMVRFDLDELGEDECSGDGADHKPEGEVEKRFLIRKDVEK